MATITDALIQEITDVIVQTVNPQQVILFGSLACGAGGPDSDLDILIVKDQAPGLGQSRRQEMAQLWRLLARFDISKDILIYSRDEIERWRDTKNHIIAHALREGRLLYERS